MTRSIEKVDVEESEKSNIQLAMLADELSSSVANVYSPPFFAATDFVVPHLEEPRKVSTHTKQSQEVVQVLRHTAVNVLATTAVPPGNGGRKYLFLPDPVGPSRI